MYVCDFCNRRAKRRRKNDETDAAPRRKLCVSEFDFQDVAVCVYVCVFG